MVVGRHRVKVHCGSGSGRAAHGGATPGAATAPFPIVSNGKGAPRSAG